MSDVAQLVHPCRGVPRSERTTTFLPSWPIIRIGTLSSKRPIDFGFEHVRSNIDRTIHEPRGYLGLIWWPLTRNQCLLPYEWTNPKVELKARCRRPNRESRPINAAGGITNNRPAGGETADCFDDANSGQTALQ